MSRKNKEGKKLRQVARKTTQKYLDNIHTAPVRTRIGMAIKIIFGRDIKNDTSLHIPHKN